MRKCKECGAYASEQYMRMHDGVCRANPPMLICVGMAQPQSIVSTGVHPQVPVVQSCFPPVGEDWWCCAWRPRGSVEGETDGDV